MCSRVSPGPTKVRRVRQSTALTLVLFVIGDGAVEPSEPMPGVAKLVGKLSDLHPAEPKSTIERFGAERTTQGTGQPVLAGLMRERCQVLAQPQSMPSAFFGRYRLMAIDGTVFNTPDTTANAARVWAQQQSIWTRRLSAGALCALGRVWQPCGGRAGDRAATTSRKCMGRTACLSRLVPTCWCWWTQASPRAAFSSTCASARAHVLGALEAGAWEHLSQQRRLADGSVLAWVVPRDLAQAHYPVRRGMWVRIISYRVTDERLGEVGKVYRLVTTLLNPRVAPALDADCACIMSAGKSNWSSMRSKRTSEPNARSCAPRRRKGCARNSTVSSWRIMPCASCWRKRRWRPNWTLIASVLPKDSLN